MALVYLEIQIPIRNRDFDDAKRRFASYSATPFPTRCMSCLLG